MTELLLKRLFPLLPGGSRMRPPGQVSLTEGRGVSIQKYIDELLIDRVQLQTPEHTMDR